MKCNNYSPVLSPYLGIMVLYDLQLKEIVLVLSAQESVHACSQRTRVTVVKIFNCGKLLKYILNCSQYSGTLVLPLTMCCLSLAYKRPTHVKPFSEDGEGDKRP